MTRIINRRSFIVTLSLFTCLGIFNALRPVYGHRQEEDLKKQVETLTQKTGEQQNALDALKTELAKFKTAVVERDKSTRQWLNQQDQRWTQQDQRSNAEAKSLGQLIESARQQEIMLRQLNQVQMQHRDAILKINARLQAKGI